MSLEKQIESKIKENSKVSKSNKKGANANYIKVSNESLNGSKNEISINSLQ